MATSCTCGASGGQQKSTKKLTRRISSKKGDQKNPYSDRGIDKFSALLAEVEEKKRMIYSQMNPEEVSLIRFVPAGDSKLKPVVVRAASNKTYNYKEAAAGNKVKAEEVKAHDHDHHVSEELLAEATGGDEVGIKKKEIEEEVEDQGTVLKLEIKLPRFDKIQPCYYMLGGMVILVLILMAMFGRYWKTVYLLQLRSTICPKV